VREIKKDEEIVVDYGYEAGCGPKWYKELLKKDRE